MNATQKQKQTRLQPNSLSQPCKPTQANSVAAAQLSKRVLTPEIPAVYEPLAELGGQKVVHWSKQRGAKHHAESRCASEARCYQQSLGS